MSEKNKITRPCGCGERHIKGHHKEWVSVMGSLWKTECAVEHLVSELTASYIQVALYKLFRAYLEEKHPEIDVKSILEQVVKDAKQVMDDQEEGMEILEKELEDRKNVGPRTEDTPN